MTLAYLRAVHIVPTVANVNRPRNNKHLIDLANDVHKT